MAPHVLGVGYSYDEYGITISTLEPPRNIRKDIPSFFFFCDSPL